MSNCLCDKCAALCCRYIALPLDNPTTRKDYDNIRWYLIHENIVVFIEKRQWYLGVMTRCKHLQADNRCGIYDIRPRICRSYSTDNCDYHGGEYEFDVLFTSGDQLRDYAEKKLGVSIIPHSKSPRAKRQPTKVRRRRNSATGTTVVSLPQLNGPASAPLSSPSAISSAAADVKRARLNRKSFSVAG